MSIGKNAPKSKKRGGSTFLRLVRKKLANQEKVEGHREDWSLNLDRLKDLLSSMT